MDQATSAPPPGLRVVPAPSHRSRRLVIAFALIGVLLALGSGGLYVYRSTTPAAVGGPDEAVRAFLTAAFLLNDEARLAPVLCGSWAADEALQRTRSEVDAGMSVTWDSVQVINVAGTRASVGARLGVRPVGSGRMPEYTPWRFMAVDEEGWRICEARPFVG